jgi:hypothetical protein
VNFKRYVATFGLVLLLTTGRCIAAPIVHPGDTLGVDVLNYDAVVALEPSIVKDDATIAPVPRDFADWRGSEEAHVNLAHVNKEQQPREVAQWPT